MAALAGCSSLSDRMLGGMTSIITPYRVEIVQGNAITREQMERVKVGQNRAQVREVLGSPLLADPFHAQRWDYVFLLRRPGTEPQQRSVVVLFDGDVVKSIDAPELPSEREFIASITRNRGSTAPEPTLELTDAQRQALPIPPKPASSPEGQVLGAVRSYPPLEPQ
ncbi:MAG TPA: outer membrane protein assembly factor BamE [Ideonella sp.]|nr:outer membrane protein assembly factor BamE [Ideonella sp.]